MTLMGLCGEVRSVRASELLDYTDYEGDYEDEMGIGRPPEFTPLLEIPELLIMAWGATVPMIAHAVGIELDEITTTWEKWVTDTPRKTAKGVIEPGNVAAIRFTINGVYDGRDVIVLEHVNRIGLDAAPDWPSGNGDDVYRVDIDGLTVDQPGDGVPLQRRHRPRARRRRLPGHRDARAQRRTGGQRPRPRLGDPARPAARPRGRHHPLTRFVCGLAGCSPRGAAQTNAQATLTKAVTVSWLRLSTDEVARIVKAPLLPFLAPLALAILTVRTTDSPGFSDEVR